MKILLLVLAILVLPIAIKIAIRVAMLLFLRSAVRAGLGDIGQRAADKQPDRIHLTPAPQHAWDDATAARFVEPLRKRGFADAGTFGIDEMPGVAVRFLVNEVDAVCAIVNHHPRAGEWAELVVRFQDGTSACWTTMKSTGLDARPGHPIHREPGATVADLVEKAKKERPRRLAKTVTAGNVVAHFEEAYAAGIAWRKKKGVSPDEVVRVAQARPARAASAQRT